MLKIFLQLLLLYAGVITGVFLAIYVFGLPGHQELHFPRSVILVFLSVINVLQISVLILATFIFARKVTANLFSSLYGFVFGLIFALSYVFLVFIEDTKVNSVCDGIIGFVVLPFLIYCILLFSYNLIFRKLNKNCLQENEAISKLQD